jgi:hypothetical protein
LKIQSGAPKIYISTKARQLDPQKPDNFFYFLIRKVVFSSKNFLSSRTEIDWIYKKIFIFFEVVKNIVFVLLFLKVALFLFGL